MVRLCVLYMVCSCVLHMASANVVFDPVHNSCCDLDVEKNPELTNFSSILDFMDRIPIKKALTDQRPIYRSHLSRF
ncbi:hypothetical protein HanRHA438_Chr05g0224461 [Helianthus annuus]|uniref:Uncharacterized protein n=1 Tax=Helianthus annuus TaxID=4232 RepID=A0A9K3IZA1_HELAN|nr:hypothetical protein HanXRQr2_Chr05g0215221 [Helianthus annuus]KAJ0577058.1 hypothetical protein HanIR_Chr05g0231491 [Helianthus annuus]KAJ0584613.1 hypothetical protein HanHA89_Chr05g0190601 [Helianthus annuus]KAJ0750279.1 hypothetical protein HanLR1_Chr05g0180011 [Helianthus annuus]KAJ0919003.1 hypothetical protein HanRHA438_Chr05g0224461 [Helianthus annuus]